jgi:hypothetical protein
MTDGVPVTPQNPDNDTPATPPQNPPAEPDFEFDGEFDAERAKRKIAALAADKREQQERAQRLEAERDELAAKVAAEEAAKMSEAERQAAELAAAKAELAATRRKAALVTHGLPESALIFLTAETAEDIEQQAAALAALHGPGTQPPAQTPDLHTQPTPDLPPSAGPQIPPVDPPFDPVAIARKARGGR